MITIENIVNDYPKINQDSLPDALKQDEFEFILENIDLYNEDETIQKYIDTFIDKLNTVVKKDSKSAKPKPEPKDDKPGKLTASDIPAIVKKFMPKFQQEVIIGSEEHFEIVKRLETEIKAIPKDTRDAEKAYQKAKKDKKVNYRDFQTVYAHFFHGGSNWYVLSWDGDEILYCYVILNGDTQMSETGDVALSELHENNIELDFFWEIKSLSAALYAAYPDEFPKPGTKSEPEGKSKEIPEESEKKEIVIEKTAKPVEKVGLEITFIKRFIGLHNKSKDKKQILSFLNTLQKAIIEKRIRKTSLYAKEIKSIQDQLIKCYKQMKERITIKIDEQTLENYSAIAVSEKAMLSVTYIKQYISLHGKSGVKEKAQALYDRIEKALASDNITTSDPYFNEISEIQGSLKSYLGNKTKAPAITESTLNGIMTWMGNRMRKKKVAKYLHKIYETEHGLRGVDEEPEQHSVAPAQVISSTQLPAMQFETIGLQGKYRELIGDPCEGFTAMVYGLPKSGKSTLCIDLAKHLAENHGKVLYVAIEEKLGYTLKEKFERLNAIHPDLVIAEKLPEDLSPFRFVFIDSVSKAGLTTDDLTRLHKQNPKTAFIFIFHTTKEGNFRGRQDFAHDVDVIIEVENGIAKANGRFGVGGRLKVF
jgi:regulator of replication initiation timing